MAVHTVSLAMLCNAVYNVNKMVRNISDVLWNYGKV
jgi:hypothetical protein